MYEYRVAGIARVIDGDTYDLDIDLGFYAILRIRVRLADIDTYEVYGTNSHPLGGEARAFAAGWMSERLEKDSLVIRTFKLRPDTPTADGAFGRWLGEVRDGDSGELLADALRAGGYEEA